MRLDRNEAWRVYLSYLPVVFRKEAESRPILHLIFDAGYDYGADLVKSGLKAEPEGK